MKLFFTTLIFIFFVSVSFSQTEMYWKLGRKAGLSFKSGIATPNLLDTSNVCINYASTGICDSIGDIIFYTNGFEIYNRLDRRTPNGFNFNNGLYSSQYFIAGCYPLQKSSLIIPQVTNKNVFYLFYENMEYVDAGNNYLPDKLRFLIYDKTLDGGLGDVVQKDLPLISGDTLDGGNLLGIKHGNGNDYWIINRGYHNNKIYRTLIDSFGVHSQTPQYIGVAYTDSHSVLGHCNTSPHGDKVAFIYQSYYTNPILSPGQIDLFDFDRCTGLLNNYQKIILNNTTDTIYALSTVFSQNGRFLYINDQTRLWQLDLQSPNILANRILIAKRLTGVTYRFWEMENGPDGKIYIGNAGSGEYLHVINNPDSLGLSCNFVQKQLFLGSFTNGHAFDGGLPNVPNFNLGKLNCDVGIQATAVNKNELLIYPNPASQSIVISNKSLVNTIEITDLLGQIVLAVAPSPLERAGVRSINIEALPNGIYFLKATDEFGNITNTKFVKQ